MIVFSAIFYQDIKERKIYWFLCPIVALLSGVLHYNNVLPELFYVSTIINIAFVSILLLMLFLYSKYKLKQKLGAVFGLGDALLFVALSFAFSSVSFLILFVSSLIFSLMLHLVIKQKSKIKTVPLAGYISLFFGIAYIGYWFGIINSVYTV